MRGIITIAAIVAGVGRPTWPGEVASPPLLNQRCDGTSCGELDTFYCEFLNVGKSNIDDVILQLVDGSTGLPAAEVGPLTLVPGNERLISWETGLRTAYCKAIGNVNSKKVYVTLCNAIAANKPCRTAVSTVK
jgi:hypothetical protein